MSISYMSLPDRWTIGNFILIFLILATYLELRLRELPFCGSLGTGAPLIRLFFFYGIRRPSDRHFGDSDDFLRGRLPLKRDVELIQVHPVLQTFLLPPTWRV